LQAGLAAGGIAREDIFVTTKLWNSNHRPERVEPAFEASLDRLGFNYLDLYLIHTPFAFQPGDDQDPRDQNGNVLYDHGVTLLDTWNAMEGLVDHGNCRAIGLSDISLNELKPIYESARIKPAVVQVEAHPYLPETELLGFCKEKGIVVFGFCTIRSRDEAGAARRSSHFGYRRASLERRRHRYCWLGRYSAARLCLPRQECGPREREFRQARLPEG
jgi:alcohol dehydrogenase (NADP+)